MLAPREIDEYLLPTERRVIRVRQHWAYMFATVVQTALFLLLMVVAQRYLTAGVLVDNITFYLALAEAAVCPAKKEFWACFLVRSSLSGSLL